MAQFKQINKRDLTEQNTKAETVESKTRIASEPKKT